MSDHLTQLLEPYLRLFDVKSIEAMGLRILGAVLVLLVGYWFSRALQRLLVRHVGKHDSGYEGAIDVYRAIIRSVTVVVAGGLALHTLGIDLTHLFTTGGLLAIAAAFAFGSNGALQGQYGYQGKGGVLPALGMGSACCRAGYQRIHHPGRSCEKR